MGYERLIGSAVEGGARGSLIAALPTARFTVSTALLPTRIRDFRLDAATTSDAFVSRLMLCEDQPLSLISTRREGRGLRFAVRKHARVSLCTIRHVAQKSSVLHTQAHAGFEGSAEDEPPTVIFHGPSGTLKHRGSQPLAWHCAVGNSPPHEHCRSARRRHSHATQICIKPSPLRRGRKPPLLSPSGSAAGDQAPASSAA